MIVDLPMISEDEKGYSHFPAAYPHSCCSLYPQLYVEWQRIIDGVGELSL